MQYATLLASFAATVLAGGVPTGIAPSGGTPSSCMTTYPGTFQINTLNATTTDGASFVPSKVKRQTSDNGELILSLTNSVLSDLRSNGTKYGYIASNTQFQFDNPIQAGAIYTSGFSICPLTGFSGTNVLAIGHDAIFWSCPSGKFANLYTASQGAQCSKVYIQILGGSSTAPQTTSAPQTTPAATTSAPVATQISDNQPQAATTAVTQISDNQPQAATQAPSATPVYNNGADSNGLSKMALAAGAMAMLVL